MSFKIRLNNINVPTGNQYKVFYKLNVRTPGNVTSQGDVNWGTLYGTYTGGTTTNVEIDFLPIIASPFGKQHWFKILDTVTGSYIIENIYIHEYEYYYYCDHCCDFSGGTASFVIYDVTNTPTPTPTSTSTPTPTATNTPTPTPTPTPTSTATPIPPTATPTPTSIPPTATPTPTPTATNTPTPTPTLPVTGLVWATTNNVSGSTECADAGWVISNGNLSIRYNISDSANCGGTCGLTQIGTATATITVGGFDTNLGLNFVGSGESQDAGFEKISFKLDNTLIASATSQDLNGQCAMVPVIQTYAVAPPYLLLAGTVHTLLIEFTTNDPQFHVDGFYQANLSFT